MNKKHILFHLSEARKALEELIGSSIPVPNYDFGNYRGDMEHLYQHINSASNARDASAQATSQCSEEDVHRWRKFPIDMSLLS